MGCSKRTAVAVECKRCAQAPLQAGSREPGKHCRWHGLYNQDHRAEHSRGAEKRAEGTAQ
eukprot:6193811-Pleurochrysis_carterae.AAC.1